MALPMPNYMYVSLQDEDKVLIFRLDSGTGTLTPQGVLPFQGGPSAMAMSPTRRSCTFPIVTCRGYRATRLTPIQER